MVVKSLQRTSQYWFQKLVFLLIFDPNVLRAIFEPKGPSLKERDQRKTFSRQNIQQSERGSTIVNTINKSIISVNVITFNKTSFFI